MKTLCQTSRGQSLAALSANAIKTAVVFAIGMLAGVPAYAVEPAESSVRPANQAVIPEFAVYPPEILLDSARDNQSFIAVMTRDDGVTLDVSDRVEWSIEGAAVAKIDAQALLPLADGEAQLVANYNGATRKIPVKVTNSQTRFPISFEKDVMPVLTRTGCNTGSCHGAARGKDGFRVSLFGFDPNGDAKSASAASTSRCPKKACS